MKRSNTKTFTIKILLYSFIFFAQMCAQKAVVIVPVADLVGQPMQSFYKDKKPTSAYAELPWAASGADHYLACPRLHQALFNEVVELCEEFGQEARIRLPNIYYTTMQNPNPQRDYWVLRKHIMTFDELKKHKIDLSSIPKPIEYTCNDLSACTSNTITLTNPFTCTATKQILSAGTRLVKTKKQNQKDKVSVQVFNSITKEIVTTHIPKEITFTPQGDSQKERIADFMRIVRNWAQSNGTIPYVWGGCSLTHAHKDGKFHAEETKVNGKAAKRYQRPHIAQSPKSGLDCAGLVARATQIAGIPYFYKNTYTLLNKLQDLGKEDSLQEGDLIWIPGHVMIVGCPKKNTIIEARSYDHGYGKIHEIPIKEAFKDLNTFDDLEKAFFDKKPLYRLNNVGKVMDTFKTFKLLKLSSVWS